VPARLKLRHALALGLIHGPTELLPVSSSAHTTLIPLLARWSYRDVDPQVRKTFEVCLHAGAGVALALDRRREPAGPPARDATLIATSLAPPALAGLLLRSLIARRLSRPSSIAAGLCLGSIAMVLADRRQQIRTCADASAADALALGFAQAAALAPGVSRSGATLAAARARQFTRADSRALSQRAGLAVIFAACAHEAPELLRRRRAPGSARAFTLGAAGALLSTTASLRLQRRLFRTPPPLWPFAVYRLALAALIMRRRAR
jgi:undecaprenyl-diphosphatase